MSSPAKTLGVVGTLVWDRIVGRGESGEPVEEWGGISYALAALAASLPDGWRIRPIMKVGRDLWDDAFDLLGEIPRLDTGAIVPSDEPNNRVELRYQSEARRCERLTGGVPPWTWSELASAVEPCDALYVNFISGFEMELETAAALRAGYGGPIYADMHSLFLHMDKDGNRVPQLLARWGEWFRCFDGVQMNEDEFALLSQGHEDPWQLAAGTLGHGLKLVTVTLGEGGSAYVASNDFQPDPLGWPARRAHDSPEPASSHRYPVEGGARVGDPTGCGDVWGATFYAGLLSGDTLEGSMVRANNRAASSVEHLGARGLAQHLSDRSHVEGR